MDTLYTIQRSVRIKQLQEFLKSDQWLRIYCVLSGGIFYFEPPCRWLSYTHCTSWLQRYCVLSSGMFYFEPPCRWLLYTHCTSWLQRYCILSSGMFYFEPPCRWLSYPHCTSWFQRCCILSDGIFCFEPPFRWLSYTHCTSREAAVKLTWYVCQVLAHSSWRLCLASCWWLCSACSTSIGMALSMPLLFCSMPSPRVSQVAYHLCRVQDNVLNIILSFYLCVCLFVTGIA